jgi:hypothetical protein
MKHGRGIKGRDDKSSGIEILMAEAFAKINPTDPLILAKQAARRKRNWNRLTNYRFLGSSLARADASPWHGGHEKIVNDYSHRRFGLKCQLRLA